ncbi:hypothetical protein MKW92_039200, partial [Papaver armeniacum]
NFEIFLCMWILILFCRSRISITTALGFGSSKLLSLSKPYDSSAGYLVNDACEVRVEVTCKVTAKATNDNETENPISKVPEVDLENKTKPNVESSLLFGEHPSAEQPFKGEKNNCEVMNLEVSYMKTLEALVS